MQSARLARLLGYEERAASWEKLAQTLKGYFDTRFVTEDKALYDHLNVDGSPDLQIRPNQVFAVTVPFAEDIVGPAEQSGVVRRVVSDLTYPYGVASLSQNDEYFHPFHHNQIYHFDAAYHNGLCWQWLAGPVIGAMAKLGYADLAFTLTMNLADQILNLGMPGSMSELVEPMQTSDGSLRLSGTYSQAWSVSEFVRNFYQDYLGLKPDMTQRQIVVAPRLPAELSEVRFVVHVGDGERIEGCFEQNAPVKRFSFTGSKIEGHITIVLQLLNPGWEVFEAHIPLENGKTTVVHLTDPLQMRLDADGREVQMRRTGSKIPKPDKGLGFQEPHLRPDLKALQMPDFLQRIRTGEAK
jgi:hypothetical protein